MKSKKHFDQCKNLASYCAAQRLGCHLKEVARENGYDPKGIKILDKSKTNGLGDSSVTWNEGPNNWPTRLDLFVVPGVCHETHTPDSISFYDIVLPMVSGGDY